MEKKQPEDTYNNYYRGIDLMEPQRKLLFQKFTEAIKKQEGELAYLLACKENNSQIYDTYRKELEWTRVKENNPEKVQELENKMAIIDKTQGEILLALQPPFHEMFNQVGDEVSPGLGYNEELRHTIRFDLIFGERELSNAMDHARENYRIGSLMGSRQERYEKKLQKLAAKRKAEKEKVRLPKDHTLITKENYEKFGKNIAKHMEEKLKNYGTVFTLDTQKKEIFKQILEKYFLYMFIHALIDTKLIFDIKSTKGGICLDGTIEVIITYFEKLLGQKLEINPKSVKRRLWSNSHSDDVPMDLSYQNALLEDVEHREKYLNTTYFTDKGTSVNDLRIEIMKEYNSQEGLKEKALEMLNPRYHIYKDQISTHQKHLKIIQDYQKNSSDEDSRIADIIKDINQKLVYAQEKKKEHTIFEEDVPKIKPKFDHSLTEIQNRHMKRYQVPIQYRRIFGIVMNKTNNFFQYKIGLIKKTDKANSQLFDNLLHSNQSNDDLMYFLHNYITNKNLDTAFDSKREKKRSDRVIELANTMQKVQKPSEKLDLKDNAQLSLDF